MFCSHLTCTCSWKHCVRSPFCFKWKQGTRSCKQFLLITELSSFRYLRYSVILMNRAEVPSSRYHAGHERPQFYHHQPRPPHVQSPLLPPYPRAGKQTRAVTAGLGRSTRQQVPGGFWLCWLLLLSCRVLELERSAFLLLTDWPGDFSRSVASE